MRFRRTPASQAIFARQKRTKSARTNHQPTRHAQRIYLARHKRVALLSDIYSQTPAVQQSEARATVAVTDWHRSSKFYVHVRSQ